MSKGRSEQKKDKKGRGWSKLENIEKPKGDFCAEKSKAAGCDQLCVNSRRAERALAV